MNEISDIISYYRECISIDLKAVSIYNFFGKDVSHQYILESSEHLSNSILETPIDSSWGQVLDEELLLHSKEKQLYTGAFFIKGKVKRIGRRLSAFIPLYLYETFLNLDKGVYYISVDRDNSIINPAFFEYLNMELNLSSDLQKKIVNELPRGILNFDALIKIKELLESISQKLNTSFLAEYIASDTLVPDLDLIASSRSKKYYLTILPGITLGLCKKSKGAMGVLQELDQLIQNKSNSKLLNEVFGLTEPDVQKLEDSKIHPPSSLSESQKKVFHSLSSNNTTLVIGPPGTGKTFTIANLAAILIAKGKSALIVCKTSQAANVVVDKIQNELKIKGKLINATSLRYKKSIESRLSYILFTSNRATYYGDLKMINTDISRIDDKMNLAILAVIESEKDELEWGKLYFSNKNKFVKLFFSKWIEYRKDKKESITYYIDVIRKLEKKRSSEVKRFIEVRYKKLLYTLLTEHRQEFITLLEALKEETGNLIHNKFNEMDFSLILRALPIWVCTTNNLHNILPLEKDLFDTVIIDEATQCDIPSAIPLLYRAKKAVVVGDPKQLRHISFLSQSQERSFRKKYKINQSLPFYRDASILDLVNKNIRHQDQVAFLNEHYRSTPSIIEFSNKYFYEEGLHIMTDRPTQSENPDVGLHLVSVDGQRDIQGFNQKETDVILKYISNIISIESSFDKKHKSSIGVLSPFRAQVNHLKKAIRKVLHTSDIRDHKILIGTPYHFQGEEKDIMYLSFSLDNDAHPSSLQYLNKEDVFNVSITRARKTQVVFTSLDYKKLNSKYLVSQYLNSIFMTRNQDSFENFKDDDFCNEVSEALQAEFIDATIIKKYFIGALEVDILLTNHGKIYCIDLIGYPGDFAPMLSIETIRMLDRMGLNILFVSYSDWKLNRESTLRKLIKRIK